MEVRARRRATIEIAGWCSRRPGFSASKEDPSRFWKDTTQYEAIVSEANPHRPSDLHVFILRREPRSRVERKPKAPSIRLNEVGKYRKVRAEIDPALSSETEKILGIVQIILVTFYRWFEEELILGVADQEKSVADDLYSTLRVILADAALYGHVWLSTYDGETGYYLADSTAVRMAVDHLKAHDIALLTSPAMIISEFVTDVIGYAVANSRIAIEKGACVEFDLTKSKYARSKSVLASAQRALVNADVAAIYPIKREGKFLLAAIFPAAPAEQRSLIERAIATHRDHLVERFDHHRGSLRKLRAALERSRGSFAAGKVGELVGGLLRGYFGD